MEETRNCSIGIKYDFFVATNKTQQSVIVISFSTLQQFSNVRTAIRNGRGSYSPLCPYDCRSRFYKQLYSVIQLCILSLTMTEPPIPSMIQCHCDINIQTLWKAIIGMVP